MILLLKIAIILLINHADAFRARNFRNTDPNSIKNFTTTTTSLISTCDDVCLTPGCISTAASIFEKMDEKIDPCDDFYAFR